MNALGILVDLSHCGRQTAADAIRLSKKPVAFTHTGCQALADHPRNRTDEELRAVADKGGVSGIYFMPYLSEGRQPTASDIVRHLEHMGSTWSGFIRADYVHVGEVRIKFPTPTPTDPFNAVIVSQDAFDTANARVSFQRGPLGLDVYGNNLLDERGVVGTAQPSFGGLQNITRPREVGVELRYSF